MSHSMTPGYLPSGGYQAIDVHDDDQPDARLSGPDLGGVMRYLLLVIGISFGGFLVWGFSANLDSAAYGSGKIVVESHRKTIQHLEGGIIKTILVKEGDKVRKGQVLLELDGTQAQANLDIVQGQLYALQARRARLLAELENASDIDFPAALRLAAENPEVEEVLVNQTDLFTARRDAHLNQVSLLQNQVEELNDEISALSAQAKSASEQLVLIAQEISGVKELLDKGLETKPRLLALQRAASELRGRRGEMEGRISQSRQTIGTTQLKLVDLENQRRKDIVDQLDDTQNAIADLSDRVTAARDVVNRRDIVAPEDGVVVNLKVSTPGGVIAPGEPLMDLVPQQDELIIDARLRPDQITMVHEGLPAKVQLLAYSRRRVPMLPARVIHVSADQLVDPQGTPYFEVKVELTDEAEKLMPDFVELVPGMPANVLIALGERKAIDYLLSPLETAAALAMRER